jgi:hypothetical protein
MLVVRPPTIKTTPSTLAKDLGWKTRFYPNPKLSVPFDYKRDFFMTNVHPNHVEWYPDEFQIVYGFFAGHKCSQRLNLESAGIPVPLVAAGPADVERLTGEKFVVRPLRHSGGRDYRITDNRLDFVPGTEYISEFYPKRREYRVIFVFGKPLIWLRKKPNEGVEAEAPWGHVNSFFQTINDIPSCRLSATDCVQRLGALPVVAASHIVAADILYNQQSDRPYVVLELNMCPSLQIEGNRAKVVETIRART